MGLNGSSGRSGGLNPLSSPAKSGLAGFAATMPIGRCVALSVPYRSGLGPRGPMRWHGGESSLGVWPRCSDLLCPLLTSAAWSAPLMGRSVPVNRDTRQTSRGKFDCFRRTTAGFTLRALDGYGLGGLMPAGPALTPQIRFLFISPRLCFALLSDLTSP